MILPLYRKALCLLLPALIGACQGANSRQPSPPAKKDGIAAVDLDADSGIALHLWDRTLEVGDSSERAARVFPEQSRAIENNDLPLALGGGFRSRVWEKGGDGFGVILYQGRVAAALSHSNDATMDRVREVVRLHESRLAPLEPSFVGGRGTEYWFWEDGSHRLMICSLRKDKALQLTIAMGDNKVMDAIGASRTAAGNAVSQVEEILSSEKSPEAK